MGMIRDLYYGDVSPLADMGYPGSEEYIDLVGEIENFEKLLLTRLSEEDRELYTNLCFARTARENMELERTFVEGFRVATLLMIDVYSDKE